MYNVWCSKKSDLLEKYINTDGRVGIGVQVPTLTIGWSPEVKSYILLWILFGNTVTFPFHQVGR